MSDALERVSTLELVRPENATKQSYFAKNKAAILPVLSALRTEGLSDVQLEVVARDISDWFLITQL